MKNNKIQFTLTGSFDYQGKTFSKSFEWDNLTPENTEEVKKSAIDLIERAITTIEKLKDDYVQSN